MSTSEGFEALRRANPRLAEGFTRSFEAAAAAVEERIAAANHAARPRRRGLRGAYVAVASLAVAVAAFAVIVSPVGGPGIADAAAAIRTAATLTGATAERSGTAVVRITRDGQTWAAATIRWHGEDLSVSQDARRRRGSAGSALLVVGGTLYVFEDGWVAAGTPESIDPGSGTTPDEYLAALRHDGGGATLRRIAAGINEPATRRLEDGSTVYAAAVPAGVIARETGIKEGRSIRLLPFGYVAHGAAADPTAPLAVRVTVGPEGVVREIAAAWGGAASWTYSVTYSGLGATAAPAAPANARPLLELRARPSS